MLFGLLALALDCQSQTSETITVTATRTETRLSDTPASVVVLSDETLQSTAAATVDDALRQVAGFSLFRRTGSRTANPTTQGVSLRGIGASGASRALVLDDGIPLNDAFGGWIYWGRVPRAAIDRIEVLRGGASDLYGSAAMGGVVQLIRRSDRSTAAEATAGSQGTYTTSFYAAMPSLRLSGEYFETAGYVPVISSKRGSVDRRADSRHGAIDATIHRSGAFLRASYFDEARNNGTALQVNETTTRQLAAGLNRGALVFRGWIGDQDYYQTFSAISADRSSERLTAEQRIASRSAGATGQWAETLGARHALLTGVEARRVGARDNGSQSTLAVFVEDVFAASPNLTITAGLRFDRWRDENAWSPRLALLYRPRGGLALTAAAYQAFRSPTLNELHRPFRVGNVLTLANDRLGAERLGAIEIGARGRHLRGTLFWMEMDDVVANVTLSIAPSLITRQRQNVATSRSRGAEVEGDWQVGRRWRMSGGYLFTDATFGDGRRVPQIPRNQLTAQLRYASRMTLAAQARWSAMQFDDDLNQFPLRGFFAVDLFASHPVGGRLDVLAAVENLFDEQIEAGAAPLITLAAPRALRVGIRYGR
jgi:outer membrane receptor protein involved in Fe transport